MACRRYTNGPHNNMSYWPLDYPPLSGYQASGLVLTALAQLLRTFDSMSSKHAARLMRFLTFCLTFAELGAWPAAQGV